MYRIDKEKNRIEALKACSFSSLGFRERAHLQEWIANEPSVFGEELLIIQKEFAGFSDTNERLDLLALDKQGSLVVIENKLDDAGRDVTWQALKYASYCAGLSRDSIRRIFQEYLTRVNADLSAEEQLCEFFDVEEFEQISLNRGVTQRVILVSANFRKEVTSTVMWLLNFKIRLQCFKVTPFQMVDQLFLNVEQIIPTRDTEQFMIGIASKAQEEIEGAEAERERDKLRREFWSEVLRVINESSDLFKNVNPSKQSWISAGSGIRGVAFAFVVTRSIARVEIYIDRGDKVENERIFDELQKHADDIRKTISIPLDWGRIDEKRACRIKYEFSADVWKREQWPSIVEALASAMTSFEGALRVPLQQIKSRLRSSGQNID